jgi:hypothetical protein
MGADLYINSVFQRQREDWEPEFYKATALRDSLQRGSPEYEKAQAQAEEYYEKMYERGYFRDPYNDHDLLWKFNLSWWDDVVPMLNARSELTIAQACHLLDMLQERHNIFLLKLAPLPAEERKYFLDRYADLQKFINDAIELNSPIDASL